MKSHQNREKEEYRPSAIKYFLLQREMVEEQNRRTEKCRRLTTQDTAEIAVGVQ